MSTKDQTIFFSILSFAFFICLLQADEEFIPAFLRMALPTFDVFSDIAYLLTNNYFSRTVFICGVVFFFVSNVLFMYFLWEKSYRPRYPWEHLGYLSMHTTSEIGSLSSNLDVSSMAISVDDHSNLVHSLIEDDIELAVVCIEGSSDRVPIGGVQAPLEQQSLSNKNSSAPSASSIAPTALNSTPNALVFMSEFFFKLILIRSTLRGFPTIAGTPLIQDGEAASMSIGQRISYQVILWILACCIQIIFSLYVMVLYPAFILVWFIVGCMLFQTKLFSIEAISSFWIRYWTGQEKSTNSQITTSEDKSTNTPKSRQEAEKEDIEADAKRKQELIVFALALFGEFVLETIPQTIIQALNNTFWQRWTFLSFFSMIFSGVIVIDGLWFFVYHRLRSKESFAEIAARMNVLGEDNAISGGRDFKTVGELSYQIDPIYLKGSTKDFQTDKVHAARQLWFVLMSSFLSTDMSVVLQDNNLERSLDLLTCSPYQLNQVIRRALELARYDGKALDPDSIDYKDFKTLCGLCDEYYRRRYGFLTPLVSFVISPIRFGEIALKGKLFHKNGIEQIKSLLKKYRKNNRKVDDTKIVEYYESLLEIFKHDRQHLIHLHPSMKRSRFHNWLNASLENLLLEHRTNEKWKTALQNSNKLRPSESAIPQLDSHLNASG
jgi:hypothetical protein